MDGGDESRAKPHSKENRRCLRSRSEPSSTAVKKCSRNTCATGPGARMSPSRRWAPYVTCACGQPSAPSMRCRSGTAEASVSGDSARGGHETTRQPGAPLRSLPCHGDVILERLVLLLRRLFLAQFDQNGAKRASGEDVARVIARNRPAPVQPHVDGLHRKRNGHCLLDAPTRGLLAVDENLHRAAFADPASVVVEMEAQLVLPLWQPGRRVDRRGRAEVVIPDLWLAVLEIEAHAPRAATVREDHAVGLALR